MIRFDQRGHLGLITIDRPEALNAMTAEMAAAVLARLRQWQDDPAIGCIAIRGNGKAFSAGGDVRLVHAMEADAMRFFTPEYDLCRAIREYPKPVVAVMDGIVFGGGVGISIYASHRIATHDTLWAMPECAIGFYPDIGATWFLPRLPGEIGTWLALTGARLKAGDLLALGIATGFTRDAEGLLDSLALEHLPDNSLSGVEPGELSQENRQIIDRCFTFSTVQDIIAALQAEPGAFAQEAVAAMNRASPTSLAVTLRQMRVGKTLGFDEALALEHRLTRRFLGGHDFFEGVRAALIDRDGAPRWEPATLDAVDDTAIDAYFAIG